MKRRNAEKSEDENGFEGGYMACKIAKLEDQFKKNAAKKTLVSKLFEGISVFVNGYTRPSPEELKMIMAQHGGTYHTYQRSWTTFVVANNLPDVKIRALGKNKVIRADWIVDCLEAGKILDYSRYLLYNEKSDQPNLFQFGQKKEEINVSCEVKGPEEIKDSQLDLLCETLRKEHEAGNNTIASDNKLPPKAKGPKCATDPGFLKEFFKKSRLHLIATMGANFKQYVTELRKKYSGDLPMRSKLIEGIKRSESVEKTMIMHIDMDCFFVSVGLRNRPHLRNLPVAVTHSMGSEADNVSGLAGSKREHESVMHNTKSPNAVVDKTKIDKIAAGTKDSSSYAEIASCSYEARKFGIRNGMFVGAALKLCPDLHKIPYDFEAYQEVAQSLYRIIAQYTLDIEAVSCDEMYVDLSELLSSTKVDVMGFVSYIRDEIKETTGCPCSAGLGRNKLQARLATKEAKPDGQHFMENIEEYIKSLPITELPGVGYSTSVKLEKLGLKTCEDLQKLSIPKLHLEFGRKFGETLFQFCRGIDTRTLQLEHIRQSISVDVNYGIRFKAHPEVEFFLEQVAEELHDRMQELNYKGKKLSLKIMVRAKDAPAAVKYLGTGFCDTVNKTTLLHDATNDKAIIGNAIVKMYRELNLPPEELRGIGIGMTKLESSTDAEVKVNRIMELFKNVQPKKNVESPQIDSSVDRKQEELKNETLIRKDTKTTPKKRGRPSKTPQTPIKGTLPHIFGKKKMEECEDPDLPGLDEDFLLALPEDIRQEVVRNREMLMKQERVQLKSTPHVDNSIETNVMESPVKILQEEVHTFEQSKPNAENIFLRSDFAIVISNWISVTQEPTEQDLEVMKYHARELIQEKELSPLYLALRLLCRKINELDCETWHWFFKQISEDVQTAMLLKFNKKLVVNTLECPKCK